MCLLCMHGNGYLWTSSVNLDITVRFPDPDFRIECEISAIWRRFPLIFFAFYMLKVRQSRFVWPTGLESIPHASTRTAIISTKFEVGMAIHYRVIAFLLLIRYVTLWPWSLTCWPRTVVTVVIHTWAPKCRPPKDTSLRGSAEPCRLTYFASKSVRVSAVAFFKNPPPHQKNSWVTLSQGGAKSRHAQKRNPLTDLDKILHGGRYPRHNHLHKFWWPSG